MDEILTVLIKTRILFWDFVAILYLRREITVVATLRIIFHLDSKLFG
jgi:hypothetical protein